MQTKTNFEKSLCESAGLFSLSKKHADLFLLSQTGMITYQQLALCRLHGKTEASGRLSLKKLEKEGVIQARKLPNQNQNKYYSLTSKGRILLRKLFPASLLEYLQINLEKRLPGGSQQIYHRIRTNDFYFTYIGSLYASPVPWILEHPLLPDNLPGREAQPRCDGFLITAHTKYYIEQDNSTQSENVILQKLLHYQKGNILCNTAPDNVLVFCLSFPKEQPPASKPSFSLYRVLLHFTKIWALFEEDCRVTMDYQQFLQVLESSPLKKTISVNEMQTFQNLHRLHPEMDNLTSAIALKKGYLDDNSYSETQERKMDIRFRKRLLTHFQHIYSFHPTLVPHALKGNPIFAVPNHRLSLYQPYIMPFEYDFPKQLLKCLLYNGLNTDGWEYHSPLPLTYRGQPEYWFFQGFVHKKYGYIACEHLTIDLSSRVRIQHYLKSGLPLRLPVFLLLFASDQEADDVQALSVSCEIQRNDTTLLQIDSRHSLYHDPLPHIFLAGSNTHSILFECDEFDEQLRFITRKENFTC